ncbi:MAG TPA: hypothetical protein VGS23_00335 [Thermoplasmata archaeon]|nr:hypothetical protein [Thermoplasmata archaeon]
MLALGALSGAEALTAAAGSAAAVAASFALRRWASGSPGGLWIGPVALALGVVALAARTSLTSEFLAAMAALALLYWIGAPRTGAGSASRRISGLLLPGTSAVLALLVTLVLPGGTARLGVASALLVVVLLALGWALRSDRTAPSEASAAS